MTAWVGGVALLLPAAFLPLASASPEGDGLVINEVYARGGSANQPYTHKFVELFNPTASDIDLAGLSLQYYSAGGTSASLVVDLVGTVPAEGYFLIQGGSNGEAGIALSGVDQVSDLSPSGTKGTIALVRGTSGLELTNPLNAAGDERFVDLVGFGDAGIAETAPASYPGKNSQPGSITRTDGADSDDNSADFTFAETPTPTGSGGATDPEPGDDPTDEPAPQVLTIAEIQGTGSESPVAGLNVTTRGIVTAAYPTGNFSGVYLQTPGTGGDVGEASHGLFAYSSALAKDVQIGDYVELTGEVSEYYGLTQIKPGSYSVLDETAEAVIPVVDPDLRDEVTREALEGMLLDLSDTDLTVTDTYQTNRYGQVGLAIGTEPLRQESDVFHPVDEEAQWAALVAENESRLITLDDGSSWDYTNFKHDNHAVPLPYLRPGEPVRVGAAVTLHEPVILDYRYQWNLQPTRQVTGENSAEVATFANTREEAPAEVGGNVSIASFNVLNYFTDLGVDEAGCRSYTDREGQPVTANYCDVRGAFTPEAFARQEGKIVSAINALDADIVGLEEMENSARFGHDRDASVAHLVDSLNKAAGEKRWAYVASPSATPADEDVIRLAFIYQVSKVAPQGESAILIGSDAFHNAREPLGQAWRVLDETGNPRGEQFATITNHFKSKGSGDDDGRNQGNANPDRIAQAQALASFAEVTYPDQPVFLLGDFNSYSAEDPLRALEAAGYTNVVTHLGIDEASYSYGSRVGSLDHVFANPAGLELLSGANIWNINSVESIALEYSRHNYNVAELFEPNTPFRSSDHDPIKVGLAIDLPEQPSPEPSADPAPTADPTADPAPMASPDQPGQPDRAPLPFTGSAVAPVLIAAIVLIALGAFLLSRRSR